MQLSGISQCLAVCILLLAEHLLATSPHLVFCDQPAYIAYSSAESGLIVSPNFPNQISHTGGSPATCELKITTCARCRIRLNFDGLQKSFLSRCKSSVRDTSAGCHLGCNHLLVYEPGYYDKTYEYITAEYMPMHYESNTREVTLRYCQSIFDEISRNFSFTYDVLEKEVETFHGHTQEVDGVPAIVGQFSSLGFPRGYSSSGDVFVYHVRNENTNGHVRLTFEDWNLSPFSSITICEGNCSNTGRLLHVTGADTRPFYVSFGNNVTVEFRTGTNIHQSYLGFRASYYLVSSTVWIDKPAIVDDRYFLSSDFGDELVSPKCSNHRKMDYLWVIPRASLTDDRYSLQLRLKTVEFSVGDSLEIRRGNCSTGELVPWFHRSELNNTVGFYVRLRMTCAPGNRFGATFMWMRSSRVDGCRPHSEFFCVDRQCCIPSSLRCDYVDHCGDGSDETGCSGVREHAGRTTTIGQCSGYFRCQSGEFICAHQRCDDKVDCEDMTDERSCHDSDHQYSDYMSLSVVVPVLLVLVIVLLTVGAMVVYSVRARRRRCALSRAHLYRQHQAALHAAGHFDDAVPYGYEAHLLDGSIPSADEPPSYAAIIQHPNGGGEQAVRPPSYQSAGEPTVKYSVVGQHEVDNDAPPPAYKSDHAAGK